MPTFDLFHLVLWLLFLAISMAGGGMLVALLLSGFEEEREDLRGLAASVWQKVAGWGVRFACLLGLGALALLFRREAHPFDARALAPEIALAALTLLFTELTPRFLARLKRGAALLALLFLLLTTFMAINGEAFGRRFRPEPVREYSAATTAQR